MMPYPDLYRSSTPWQKTPISYDALGRVVTVKLTPKETPQDLAYDAVGNLLSVTDPARTHDLLTPMMD